MEDNGNIGISDAEFEVMKLAWERSPITAEDIVSVLSPRHEWSITTVKTLIARLVKKKALKFRSVGRRYEYEPLIGRAECIRAEGEDFLERIFDGALMPMLAHFVRSRKLTDKEKRELMKILSEEE